MASSPPIDPDESDPGTLYQVVVPADLVSGRLDKVMADLAPDLSRTRYKDLIQSGGVWVNDVAVDDPSFKVMPGALIDYVVPDAVDLDIIPENIPLDILYEDDDVLVINKDADMVVHPAPGHYTGTLVHALMFHCGDQLSGIGGVKRPGIVHRLDRGTSGAMMVAKTDRAHAGLAAQLADRTLSRTYSAITFKVPIPPMGTVDAAIGRHRGNRLKMAVGGADARAAVTHYHVKDRFGDDVAARVECKLETGRTHQIRVHMAHIGYPLLGDPLYGPQPSAVSGALRKQGVEPAHIDQILSFPRQALHAQAIRFVHPVLGKNMSFVAPEPVDFSNLINVLEVAPL